MRVLIIDEFPARARALRAALAKADCEVVGVLASAIALLDQVEALAPDAIIVDTDSPTRDTLEHIVIVSRDRPRPIVMFGSDAAPDTIREVVRAGVSAYVVDGLDAKRLRSIIDVAVARFDEFQRLREELATANRKLSDRRIIDRAKGILMEARGLSEDAAYDFLRKTAMNRKQRIVDVARRVLDAAHLLG